jgi:hypothetical protein
VYVYVYDSSFSILLVWFGLVVLILAFLSALVSSFYGYSHSCLCTCIFIFSVNKAIIIRTYMEVVNTCIFVGSSFC